ncbi:SprT-like domain-containing protein [Halobacteriovorax sp. RZ-2]|uniref:SprT-like domain-containing protein n=1 Tax=unclassified Halobacteriovorax TaxID=2639665 RepID=UPI003721FAC6
MFIYNENTQLFVKKIRLMACDIFASIGLSFKRSRLHYKGVMYPLTFVVNDSDKILGFYDPLIYQVGINKCFLTINDDKLLENVLKHELAHFLVHIECGIHEQAHGVEFRNIFKRFGWDESFSKSQVNLTAFVKTNDNITAKIQKLLELAKSENEFEAKLAAKKANDLIQKHNLNKLKLNHLTRSDFDMKEFEDTYVRRVASFKRRNILHDCLYDILKEYAVSPVFSSGRGGGYLEIIGAKENVEAAHFIYDYTANAIEGLWKQAKKTSNLKGVRARNSYYKSFTKSFLNELKGHQSKQISSRELIHIKGLAEAHRNRVYPRVSSQTSQATSFDANAWNLGAKAGKQFKMGKGIGQKSGTKLLSN